MELTEFLFWICVAIVMYTYIGYGILLAGFVYIKRIIKGKELPVHEGFEPRISLVVAAYNEASCIEEKIRNCFSLDYPRDKLELIFITDGSTDETNSIIRQYEGIKLLYLPDRKGKSAAINRAMQFVNTPIVAFCDANTALNKEAIKLMVRHYIDPEIGGVSGEKRIIERHDDSIAGAGEGLYWKYESLLKDLDSKFYTVVGAAGELFSFRTKLFQKLDENSVLDDFIISMRIAFNGHRVVYEPNAYAVERSSMDLNEERKRKIRISAGAFQSMNMLNRELNLLKYPKVLFQYISHRVLRWSVAPICLALMGVLSILMCFSVERKTGLVLTGCQIVFYCLGFLGYQMSIRGKRIKIFYIPYYFIFMNMSLLAGYIRYRRGGQSAVWEKAKRQQEKYAFETSN